MEDKKEKKFYSTSEVAQMLNISRVAVFNKIKKGEIKAEKVGRNYVIPVESLPFTLGRKLTKEEKEEIDKVVDRVIKEYGTTLKLLGQE
jgi:putative resolvase